MPVKHEELGHAIACKRVNPPRWALPSPIWCSSLCHALDPWITRLGISALFLASLLDLPRRHVAAVGQEGYPARPAAPWPLQASWNSLSRFAYDNLGGGAIHAPLWQPLRKKPKRFWHLVTGMPKLRKPNTSDGRGANAYLSPFHGEKEGFVSVARFSHCAGTTHTAAPPRGRSSTPGARVSASAAARSRRPAAGSRPAGPMARSRSSRA